MEAKLTTNELGRVLKVQPQTIRTQLCVNGHYMGLRPIKMPNRLLLWDAAAAYALAGIEPSSKKESAQGVTA